MHVRPIGLIFVGGIDKYTSLSAQELALEVRLDGFCFCERGQRSHVTPGS